MVKSRNAWYVFVLMCSTLLATGLVAADAGAAGIRGVVTDSSGKPVSGAIVSLANGHGRTESAYSDAEGTFSLTTLMEGKLSLRVRKRYHNDHVLTLRLTKKTSRPLTIRLTNITDPRLLSDEHPAISFFSLIDFDRDESSPFSRRNFARDCLSCHALGGSFSRLFG